ncbi:hypothetical protein Mal64_08580 [Pseudobythopirellula maris]|uniref:Uncharacterized protein n=1 Tax=Pseudobythopirellula maris TaxID=2527991 RepID=A0A5C5ZSI5_9BACT|nr:hypothetical protein [Pseudobythopirellula maris]TWT90469.1 hypothetical protein Mal64_08580 [Pseudobythopirellula maris]
MNKSVIDAVREGIWDFEPQPDDKEFDSTDAFPGSGEKVSVLAQRASNGLPLWHNGDRLDYENTGLDSLDGADSRA